jgi:AcrR family transcriptional regulator
VIYNTRVHGRQDGIGDDTPRGKKSTRRRAGRRPGNVDTRREIIEAARLAFSLLGYDATSLREVARRACVDPALVHHYFTDKASLFVETMALPGDPRQVALEAQVESGFDGVGVVEGFLAQWETAGVEGSPSFVALSQAMSASPATAVAVREFLSDRLTGHWQSGDGEETDRRRALVSSQLVGLGWARYVMRFEPLASTPRDVVARWVGPTLDRYACGPLDPR